MLIVSRESIIHDPLSNGRMVTIAPNRVLDMPDVQAEALIKAYPELVYEVEESRAFEMATGIPHRKRK